MAAQLTALDRAKDWLEERRLTLLDLPIWLFGMGIAVLWALPFVWMVSTSFKYPSDVMTADIEWLPHRVTLDNYLKVFRSIFDKSGHAAHYKMMMGDAFVDEPAAATG